jgi:hypothetical protein
MQSRGRAGRGEKEMKESRRRNMTKMIGGPKSKIVFLYFLFAENDLLIARGMLQTKLHFCDAVEIKFSFGDVCSTEPNF